MRQSLSGVDHISRIAVYRNPVINVDEKVFFEETCYAVDPDMFNILTLELARGGHKDVLRNPQSVVISESYAKKYFTSADEALGKTIRVETHKDLGDFVIEGVIRDMPWNSHFRMDLIFQFEAMVRLMQPGDLDSWDNSNYYTYFTLREGTDVSTSQKILDEVVATRVAYKVKHIFQPLSQVYLGEKMNFDLTVVQDRERLYVFACIGVLVLFIACINYINITTAQASRRAKEIGVRKVNGALRRDLIAQFIGEAVLAAAMAMALAVLGIFAVLPAFNQFLNKHLTLSLFAEPVLFIGLAGLVFIVGLIAGAYPAFVFSNLKPIATLKGTYRHGHTTRLRDVLVAFQFIVSGTLIFSTIIIWMQLHYIQNKDVGFNRQQIIALHLRDKALRDKAPEIMDRLLEHSNIRAATSSMRLPSGIISSQTRKWEGKNGTQNLVSFYNEVDSSFLSVYGIELLAGRNLRPFGHHLDVLVNETLVKELGYTNEEILGQLFTHGDSTRVVGVVRDFHFHDFRHRIVPLRLKSFSWGPPAYISIKVDEGGVQSVLQYAEEVLKSFSGTYPFEYSFYDEFYLKAYQAEMKTAQLMIVSASLAILIVAMGLYGLILFMVNQRIREIGTRKVLGASARSIVRVLSGHFMVLIAIGYSVSCAIGYLAMDRWLKSFAYHTAVDGSVFLLTLLIIILITGAAIYSRIRYAARVNPAIVLKQE